MTLETADDSQPTGHDPTLYRRILIGLLVENLVFDSLERVTVKRWGMQR